VLPPVPRASLRLDIKRPEEPVSPYQDFMNGLDELSRNIAQKGTPAKEMLYPHRIIQAALNVNQKIRQHVATPEKFSKLTSAEKSDYTQIIFLTGIVLNDYVKACKNFDPKHSYNSTLAQLEKTAKRVSGHRSVGKIIGGVVMAFIGVLGMAASFALTFYSVGTLSLPALGLFSVSSKLAAAGVTASGIFLAHHGRRKGLAERVVTLVDEVANERKVYQKKT
jgi:hypothetical protein